MAQKYPIGTQYHTRGRHPKLCTVIDFLTTTNSAGEVVRERYVSTHEFCGQVVKDSDVPATSIAMGLISDKESESPNP